jgi:hypothetical protein
VLVLLQNVANTAAQYDWLDSRAGARMGRRLTLGHTEGLTLDVIELPCCDERDGSSSVARLAFQTRGPAVGGDRFFGRNHSFEETGLPGARTARNRNHLGRTASV